MLVAVLAAAGLSSAAPAGAVTVGTETQLRTAFANAAEASISLSGNITLSNCAASAGDLDRNSATALTVHGNGHTINQTCSQERVVQQSGSGKLTLDDIAVTGGEAMNGGGVYVDPNRSALITDATIEGNDAFTGGGGMVVDDGAVVTVRRTTIEGNNAVGAFGGGALNTGTLLVFDSLVAGNDSNRVGGIDNGSPSAVLTLRNTTLSGNTAHSNEAGVGGMRNIGFAFLNNTTITQNTGVGNNPASFRGGGLLTTAGATSVVKNSIIAGNDGGTGPDDCVGALTSDSRYDLIGDTTGCTLPPSTTTFELNVSAQLGALAFNGGQTRNHLPSPSSPAVDAGYPFPPGGPAADSCEAADQRGIPRLLCDMGAVERQVTVPSTLTVNTTADAADAVPGNASCATASGFCSLRAAVQESNRLPGTQVISLPSGTYGLAIPPASEGGFDPAAAGDLDLLDDVFVAGSGATRPTVDANDLSRGFDVAPGVSAAMTTLRVVDGTDAGGGGVRVTSASLSLGNVHVVGNTSNAAGGGISVGGLGSSLNLTNSEVSANSAPFFGGSGGGIDATGALSISGSQVSLNHAAGAGGGVRATGSVAVVQSTVAGNQATGSILANGGGISALGLVLLESTVAGNSAAAQGGGVFGSGAIFNSTVSGNTSATNGGGLSTSGSLGLLSVTVAGNTATNGGNGLHRFGSGSELRLRNTILADPGAAECAGLSPVSDGHNISRDASCGLAGAGDLESTNALLGPLAGNGGPTATRLPQAASPAVNAASAGLAFDQRGVPRPLGPAPDIGAVERG